MTWLLWFLACLAAFVVLEAFAIAHNRTTLKRWLLGWRRGKTQARGDFVRFDKYDVPLRRAFIGLALSSPMWLALPRARADYSGPSSPAFNLVSGGQGVGYGTLLAPDDLSVQFGWGDQPGAVNHWSVHGGQSNVAATLLAQGSDTNVWGSFVAQGAGGFLFGNGSGQLLSLPDPGGFVDAYPMLQASATYAGAVNYTAVATEGANVPVALVPIGAAGAGLGPGHTLSNTGAYAGGRYCIASGYASGAFGNASQSAGSYGIVTGASGYDNAITGKRVHSSNILGTNRGTTQIAEHSLCCSTSGATGAVATASGAGNSYNGLQLINNQSIVSRITVVARDTSTGATASWFLTTHFTRGASAASTTMVGSSGGGAPTFSSGTGASSWTCVPSADTTNGAGAVTCTGAAGNTARWEVRVDSAEVANG